MRNDNLILNKGINNLKHTINFNQSLLIHTVPLNWSMQPLRCSVLLRPIAESPIPQLTSQQHNHITRCIARFLSYPDREYHSQPFFVNILFHFNVYNFSLKWHNLITYTGDGHCSFRVTLFQMLLTSDIKKKIPDSLPLKFFPRHNIENLSEISSQQVSRDGCKRTYLIGHL